jgi:hypothetical protein
MDNSNNDIINLYVSYWDVTPAINLNTYYDNSQNLYNWVTNSPPLNLDDMTTDDISNNISSWEINAYYHTNNNLNSENPDLSYQNFDNDNNSDDDENDYPILENNYYNENENNEDVDVVAQDIEDNVEYDTEYDVGDDMNGINDIEPGIGDIPDSLIPNYVNNYTENYELNFPQVGRRTRRRRWSTLERLLLIPNYDENNGNNGNNENNENIILNSNLNPNSIVNNNTQNIDNNSSIIRRILETSFSHDKNKYLKVLDDPSNNIIKIRNFNSKLNINSSCPIFQTDFEENEEIGMLPCKHCFNLEAIKKWLNERKAECPVCREQFNSKEIVDNSNISFPNNSEIEPLLPENNFRERDIRITLRNMIDLIYERNEERQIQLALFESVNQNYLITDISNNNEI